MNITTPYIGKGTYGIVVNAELVGKMVSAGGDEYAATLNNGHTFTVRVGATLIQRIKAELVSVLLETLAA